MPLIYSSVSKGTVTVAEYAAFTGNFGSVAKEFLEKAGKNEGKFTYAVDGHTFNFLAKGGFSESNVLGPMQVQAPCDMRSCIAAFLTVADEAYGRAIPSEFLNRIYTEFAGKYEDKANVAKEGGLNSSLGKQLKQMMEHATQFPGEYSKVAGVTAKVNEVKGVMTENIDRMLQRGEKLELLTDKTENLMSEADKFQRTAKSVRRMFWWQNCKMKLVVAGAVLLVAVVIFLLICFSKGNCLKSN